MVGIPDSYLKPLQPSSNPVGIETAGNGVNPTNDPQPRQQPDLGQDSYGRRVDEPGVLVQVENKPVDPEELKEFVAQDKVRILFPFLKDTLNNEARKNEEIKTLETFFQRRPQGNIALNYLNYFILSGNLNAAKLLMDYWNDLPSLDGMIDVSDPNHKEKIELVSYLRFPLSSEKTTRSSDYRWLLNQNGLLRPDDRLMLTGEAFQKYMIALATREQQAANSIQEIINQANRRADELRDPLIMSPDTRTKDIPPLTFDQIERFISDGIPQNLLPDESEIPKNVIEKGLKLRKLDEYEKKLVLLDQLRKNGQIDMSEYKKLLKELREMSKEVSELRKLTKLTQFEQAQFDSWIIFSQDKKMRELWMRAVAPSTIKDGKFLKLLSRQEQKELYEAFKRTVTKEMDDIRQSLPQNRGLLEQQLQNLEKITQRFLETRKLYDIKAPQVKHQIEIENAALETDPQKKEALIAIAEARKAGGKDGDKLAEELKKLPEELRIIEEMLLAKVKKLEDEIKGIKEQQARSRQEGTVVQQPSPQKIQELNEKIREINLAMNQSKEFFNGNISNRIKNGLLAEINNFKLTDDNRTNFLRKDLINLVLERHNNEQADKLISILDEDLDFSKADYDYSISGKLEGLKLDRNKLKNIVEKIANSKKFQEGRISPEDENIKELSQFLGDRVNLKRAIDLKNYEVFINVLKRTDPEEKRKQNATFTEIKSAIKKIINENKNYLSNPSTIELFKLKVKESINEQLPNLMILTGYKSGAEEVRDKLQKLIEDTIISSPFDSRITQTLQSKLNVINEITGINDPKLKTVLDDEIKELPSNRQSKLEIILKLLEKQLNGKDLNLENKKDILARIIENNRSELGNINAKVIQKAIELNLSKGLKTEDIQKDLQFFARQELIVYLKEVVSKETRFLPNQEYIKEMEVQIEELIRHNNSIKQDDKHIASLVSNITEKIDSKKEVLSKDKTLINIPGSPIDKALARVGAFRENLSTISGSIKDIRAKTIEDIFSTWFTGENMRIKQTKENFKKQLIQATLKNNNIKTGTRLLTFLNEEFEKLSNKQDDVKSLAMLAGMNYTTDQIRQVEQNIILFNSLPSSIRSQIIPSSESQEPIDPKIVAKMLASKELENSGKSFLLSDGFENRIRAFKDTEDTKLTTLTEKARNLAMQETKLIMELQDHTKEKLPVYARWLPFITDKDDKFEQEQNKLIVRIDQFRLNKKIDLLNTEEVSKEVEGIDKRVNEIRVLKEKIEKNPAELDYEINTLNMLKGILTTENVKERKAKINEFTERFKSLREFRSLYSGIREGMTELQETQLKSMQLELALLRANVAAEKSNGNIEKADEMLLAILMKYGNNLSKLDPKLWEEITRKSDSPVDIGTLQRLELTGKLNPELVKKLIEDSSKQKAKPEPTGSVSFEEQYLQAQRQRFNDRQINIDMPLSTLVSLKGNSPAERKFATSLALNKVDNNPAMKKLLSATATINNKVGQLQALFAAAAKGTKYDELVEFMQNESLELQAAIKELKESSSISDAKYLLKELEATLKETNDLEIKTELEKRIKGVSSVVALAENKSLDELLKNITDTSRFKSDTWKAWAGQEGVILVGTIAIAVATTVLTCGTAAPLWLMALTSTVGGIVGQEVMRDALYVTNQATNPDVVNRRLTYTDRGGLLKWVQSLNLQKDKGLEEKIAGFIDDVANPYAKQFVTQFITTYIAIGAGMKLAEPVGRAINRAKDAAKPIGESLIKVLQRFKDSKLFQKLQDTDFAKTALEKLKIIQSKIATLKKEVPGEKLSHAEKAAALQRFAGEFPDELSDELFEGIVKEAIDGITGIDGSGELIASIVVAGGKGGVRISGSIKGQYKLDYKDNPGFNPEVLMSELQRRGIDGKFKVIANEDEVMTVQDTSVDQGRVVYRVNNETISESQKVKEATFTREIEGIERSIATKHVDVIRKNSASNIQTIRGTTSEQSLRTEVRRLMEQRRDESLRRLEGKSEKFKALESSRLKSINEAMGVLLNDFEDIAKSQEGLNKKQDAAVLIMDIYQLLLLQDEGDLSLPYVPHSIKHSMNVRNEVKRTIASSSEVRAALEAKYGKDGKSLALLSAWLHDIGYGMLDEGMLQANDLAKKLDIPEYKAGKGYHTRLGVVLAETSLREDGSTIFSQLDSLFGLSKKKGHADGSNSQLDDVRIMIQDHGADKNLSQDGLPGTGKHKLRPASLDGDILNFLVRLADNLDVDVRKRLYSHHNNPFFVAFLKEMLETAGSNKDSARILQSIDSIKEAFLNPERLEIYKKAYVLHLQNKEHLSLEGATKKANADFEVIIQNIKSFDESNFPHFAGMVQSHKIVEVTDPATGKKKLRIEVTLNVDNKLIPEDVRDYQVQRMKDAYKSLTFGGGEIEIEVVNSEQTTPTQRTLNTPEAKDLANAIGKLPKGSKRQILLQNILDFVSKKPGSSVLSRADFKKGQPIISTTDESNNNMVYILLEGTVSIKDENGKVIATVDTPGLIGEMSVLTGKRTANVTADTDVKMLALTSDQVRELFSDPQFVVRYANVVGDRKVQQDAAKTAPDERQSPIWSMFRINPREVGKYLASKLSRIRGNSTVDGEFFEKYYPTGFRKQSARDALDTLSSQDQIKRLKEIRAEWIKEKGSLTPMVETWIFNKLRRAGGFDEMIKVYESSTNDLFKSSPSIQSDYVLALNRTGQTSKTVEVSNKLFKEAMDKFNSGDPATTIIMPEILTNIGTSYKNAYVISNDLLNELNAKGQDRNPSKLRHLLDEYEKLFPGELTFKDSELSTLYDNENFKKLVAERKDVSLETAQHYYKAGFKRDFNYYSGINFIRTLIYSGDMGSAKKFADLVKESALDADFQKSFWPQATLLEIALLQGNKTEVNKWLTAIQSTRTESEVNSLLDHLRRWNELNKQRGESQEIISLIDSTIDRIRKGEKGDFNTNIDPVTNKVNETVQRNKSRRLEVITNNTDFGGPVTDLLVGPVDHHILRKIVEYDGTHLPQGTKPLRDINNSTEASQWIDNFVARVFQVTDLKGNRHLERLGTSSHEEIFDKPSKEILKAFGFDLSGNEATSVSALALLGIGDCRNTNFFKQKLFQAWQDMRLERLKRERFNALESGDTKTYDRATSELKELGTRDMVVWQVDVEGNIKLGGEDENGQNGQVYNLVRDKEGKLVYSKHSKKAEEHTLAIEVIRDSNGKVIKLVLRDTWYHEEYPFKNYVIEGKDLESLGDSTKGYVTVKGIKVYDAETGQSKIIDIRLKPSFYSKPHQKKSARHPNDRLVVYGHPVDPNVAPQLFFDQRELREFQDNFRKFITDAATKTEKPSSYDISGDLPSEVTNDNAYQRILKDANKPGQEFDFKVVVDPNLTVNGETIIEAVVNQDGTVRKEKVTINISKEVAQKLKSADPKIKSEALKIIYEEIAHANQSFPSGRTQEEFVAECIRRELAGESTGYIKGTDSRIKDPRNIKHQKYIAGLIHEGKYKEVINYARENNLISDDENIKYEQLYKDFAAIQGQKVIYKANSQEHFNGRPIIGRDRPIDGGIYLGGGAREAIVVDFQNSPILQAMYRSALAKASSGGKVNPEKFLRSVYDEVKSAMKIQDDIAVDNLVAKYKADNDKKISLEVFLREGVGVCRHDALACGAIIERAIKDGHISGRVSAERNKVLGSAHAWCRYTDSGETPWILDVRQNRIGKLSDVQRQNNAWSYERSNERPELEGIVNWERTVQGERRVAKSDKPEKTINISPGNIASIIRDKIQSQELGKLFTVGRSTACDVEIDDAFVSRIQARISKTEQNGKICYRIQDGTDRAPSHNGTYYEVINPKGSREWIKVSNTSPVVLPEGTKIRFGTNDHHIIELPGETKPALPKIKPPKPIDPPIEKIPLEPVDISEVTTLLRGLKMRQVYAIGREGIIKIKDPTERLSREHLRIRKISSDTYIIQDGAAKDKPSMNGTEYRKKGSDRWEKISTGEGILLKSSDEIRLAGNDHFVITLP